MGINGVKYKYFQVIDKSGLRKVVISNIKKKNALCTVAYEELTGEQTDCDVAAIVYNIYIFCFSIEVDILTKSSTDNKVKLVAITGAGDFYSSGNDLSAMLNHNDPTVALSESRRILRDLVRAFFTFPKLLICVVNGPCIGIAATTSALCDIVYATDTVSWTKKLKNQLLKINLSNFKFNRHIFIRRSRCWACVLKRVLHLHSRRFWVKVKRPKCCSSIINWTRMKHFAITLCPKLFRRQT